MLRNICAVALVVAFAAWAAPAYGDEVKEGTHEGKVVKAEAGKLTMTDKEGKNEHTHAIPADAKVTLDGKDAKIQDFKAGTMVKVKVEKKGEKLVVTSVEGKSS